MATTPVIPSVIASAMSGAGKHTKKTRSLQPDTGQRILLKAGAVSPSVATLQRRLGVPDDGYFGPVTEKAVKKFQQRHHLPVTGMVDVKTWLKLFPDGMVIYAPHTGVAQLSAQAPKAVLRNASQQSADSGVATMNVANKPSDAQGASNGVAATVSAASHGAKADVLPSKGSSGKAAGTAHRAVSHHASSGSGSNSGSGPRGNLSGSSSMIAAMIAEANRIDAHHYAYSWGGGHNSSFSGPYDCSGAVSAVLHAAGLISRPMVSGEFMHWGAPGPGAVTIYANAGHVYMSILGHFFGTSYANPGGGAGWFNGSARPGFVVVHVPFSSLHMSKRQLRHFLRMAAMRRASSGGGSSSGGAAASSDPPDQPRHIRYAPVTPHYSGQAPGSSSGDGDSSSHVSSASNEGDSSSAGDPSSGASSGGVASGGSSYSSSGSSDQQTQAASSEPTYSANAPASSGSASDGSGSSGSSSGSYSSAASSGSSGLSAASGSSQGSGSSGGSYSSGSGSSGSGSSGSGSSGSSGSGSSGSGSSVSHASHAGSSGSSGSGSSDAGSSGSSGSGSYSSGSAPSASSSASQASSAASSAESSASSAASGASESAGSGGGSSDSGSGGGSGGGSSDSGGYSGQ